MANFENDGYCPDSTISKILVSNPDSRLFGLWSVIGKNVVCIDQHPIATVNHSAVEEMFTQDPIAYRLMKRIIDFSSNVEKISIYQDHKDGCINMQSFSTISEKFSELKNPELVVTANSKFAIIICEDAEPNSIAVYFWDLSSCI